MNQYFSIVVICSNVVGYAFSIAFRAICTAILLNSIVFVGTLPTNRRLFCILFCIYFGLD